MSRLGEHGRITDTPAQRDRGGGGSLAVGNLLPSQGWVRRNLATTIHEAIHDESVMAAAKPVGREVWLACPKCGHVSKRAMWRNEDGSCKSEARCLANQRENEREDAAVTALNGPRTKPADTPSLKIALLRLLRDEAKPEGSYGHVAVDNGSGRCTVCGRPGAFYGVANQPDSVKTFQHKRGWAGRAKRSKVTLTPVDMAKRLGSDPHNVTHLLFSLQKAGLITFRENKNARPGDTTALENIRLTTLGLSPYRKQGSVEDRIAQAEAEVSTNGMFRPDDLTPSDTEIGNDVAVDGVVAKVHEWVFDVEPVVEPEPSHVEPDGETPQPIDVEKMATVMAASMSDPDYDPDHPANRLSPEVSALNGDKYPGLLDLLTRESKRRDALEATTLLERAGLIDLATQVVTAIPDNTELEQEVIDYLAEIGVKA